MGFLRSRWYGFVALAIAWGACLSQFVRLAISIGGAEPAVSDPCLLAPRDVVGVPAHRWACAAFNYHAHHRARHRFDLSNFLVLIPLEAETHARHKAGKETVPI